MSVLEKVGCIASLLDFSEPFYCHSVETYLPPALCYRNLAPTKMACSDGGLLKHQLSLRSLFLFIPGTM